MSSEIGTLGDTELALTPPIFAQINQFTKEIQEFSGNGAITACPRCSSTKINLLSQWERDFLASVQGKRLLSPQQQEALNRIGSKVGGNN